MSTDGTQADLPVMAVQSALVPHRQRTFADGGWQAPVPFARSAQQPFAPEHWALVVQACWQL